MGGRRRTAEFVAEMEVFAARIRDADFDAHSVDEEDSSRIAIGDLNQRE